MLTQIINLLSDICITDEIIYTHLNKYTKYTFLTFRFYATDEIIDTHLNKYFKQKSGNLIMTTSKAQQN